MISDIIQIGTKVEVCLLQQIDQERRTGVRAHRYKSQVADIFSDEELELVMPTEAGKLILLPIDVRFEFVFFCNGGMYRGTGVVKERYKSQNMYMLRISLSSPLCKFQRREFFRIPCSIHAFYYEITDDQALNMPPEQFAELVEQPEVGMTIQEGTMLDISGGGLRFLSGIQNKNESYVLLQIQFQNKEDAPTFLIPTYIIASIPAQGGKEKRFENRAVFIIRENRIREEIIRFIFDEERKIRNKELRDRAAREAMNRQNANNEGD